MKATGLLSGLQQGVGSGTGPQDFTAAGDGNEGQPNVSPEEQQQYDAFVKNGMEIIYNQQGKVEPEVLKRLSTGNKPMDTLAQTTVWLVMMLEQNAKQKGVDLSDDVVMHGGRELFEQLVDVDDAAGIRKFTQGEQQGAWYQALDMYREANSQPGDRFKPDEAKAIFGELKTANDEGNLDQVAPGLTQNAEKAIAAAKQDGAPTPEQGGGPGDTVGGDQKVLNPRSTGAVGG